jgi:lysophospholipase L1-like esterase
MLRTSRYLVVLLLLVSSVAASAQTGFYLKPNDRVVFYGDSITDQRLYTTFTETFVVTRFPKLPVTFVHSGWGGDRVGGGGGGPIDQRLKRDVFAYKPTVMTIMLGMNDASYRPYDSAIFETYVRGYKKLVRDVRSAVPGIRMTLIQPSPFDDVTRKPNFEGGYNAVLLRYGDFLKQYAEVESLDTADLNTGVVNATMKAYASDPALAEKLNPDRVHPAPSGQLLMAAELLKAWRAPAIVSEVELDAGSTKISRTVNTRLSGLQWGTTIAWDQTDEALPMPVDLSDNIMALAVRSSDFMQSLNQQPLRVTGLGRGTYDLKIDGETVGSFDHGQLSQGINLAALPTPMVKQAAAVHALTLKHNEIHFRRWRQIQVPFEKDDLPSMPKALAGLDALEQDVIKLQRAAAQPKPHRYELAKR